MRNTIFKNKVVKLAMPIVAVTPIIAATALVYAQTTEQDYTPGNYIIIGSPTAPPNQQYNISISGGSTSYEMYLPGQQATPFQNYNPPQWNLYNSNILSLGNLGLGAGSGLYQMSLANPQQLLGDFSNILNPQALTGLGLASILYTVGTYAPVLKEAMVGADNISKQMAMFTSQALGSLQNTVNSLPSGVKQAVQSCVTYNLTGGQQFSGLSLSQVMSYLGSNNQAAFNSLVDTCMQGQSIVQTFNGNPQLINNYLNQFNPRVWMQDDIQQAGLYQNPQDGNLYASDTVVNPSAQLYSLFNPQLVAKDMLIAAQPSVQYNQSASAIVPQFVYITQPDGTKLLVSLANFDQDIKAIVDEQLNATLTSMSNATDFNTYYTQYVVPINNALSLTGNDFYNYWYVLYNAVQTYKYAYQNGTLPPPHDNIMVTQPDLNSMQAQIADTTKKLKDIYTAYFEKLTLKYLQQEAQQNEQKYMAEHVMNSKPGATNTTNTSNNNGNTSQQVSF
jgi:hypothetical protein